MQGIQRSDQRSGRRIELDLFPKSASLMIIVFLTAVCLLTIPVPAADIIFTGNVTEQVKYTDITTPIGGFGVSLYTGSAYSGGVKQVDYTFTDSHGEYSLKLTPVTDPQVSNAFIVINKGTELSLKGIQSPGGNQGDSAEIFGKPQNDIVVIKYSAPLSGKDYSHNNFLLESEFGKIPPGTMLLKISASAPLPWGSIGWGTEVSADIVTGSERLGNIDFMYDYSDCRDLKNDHNRGPPSGTVYSIKDSGTTIRVSAVFQNASSIGSYQFLSVFSSPDPGNLTPCTIKIIEVQGNKPDGSPVTFLVKDAHLESVRSKGDCNGDGVISSIDALMALQMSTGEIPVDPACDMNGDGAVTSFDAVQILNQAGKSILWQNSVEAVRIPSGSRLISPGPTLFQAAKATPVVQEPVSMETIVRQRVVRTPLPALTTVPAATTTVQETTTPTPTPAPVLTEEIVGVYHVR